MSYATFTPHAASITSFKTADGKNLAVHFENEANYDRPENLFLGIEKKKKKPLLQTIFKTATNPNI